MPSFTTLHRCLKLVKENPGINVDKIPKNIRSGIKQLEIMGKIRFEKGGWYPNPVRQQ